jgi:pimeloyl-ACP methyl ester carboxylesterase
LILRPAFSRSLRDLPQVPVLADEDHRSAVHENLGLIQDLAIRMIGSESAKQPARPLGSRVTELQTLLLRNRLWDHHEATSDPDRGVEDHEANLPTQANWTTTLSTEFLERFQQPIVRDRLRESLRSLRPGSPSSPDSSGASLDSPASPGMLSKLIEAGTLNPDYSRHFMTIKTAEIMAMKLAYQRPIAGVQNPFQLPLGAGNSHVDYTAESVPIALGLEAYGFNPVNAHEGPPILLFRGTVTSPAHRAAGVTWLADLDPFGVGWGVFQFGSHDIGEWLRRATERCGRKAMVVGHSLGGAHATYAGVYHPQHIDSVLAFNPPAVSFLAKRRWDSLHQANITRPAIWNFINTRDDISHLGQEVVGEDFFVHVSREAATGPAFHRPNRLWSGHSHHSQTALNHSHALFRGQRTLSSYRYLVNALTAIFFFAMYALVIAKRLLVGHASGSRYASLVGWISLILGALATVILQLAVLVRLGILRIRGAATAPAAESAAAAGGDEGTATVAEPEAVEQHCA